MKIKKFNENSSQLPIKEIERIRNNHFNKEEIEYTLYGEGLAAGPYSPIPNYAKLHVGYSIEECVNFYNENKENKADKGSRLNKFDNVLLVKETKSIELLDLDIHIATRKYKII